MIEDTPKELPKLFNYLWALIKNPVEEIKNLPEIKWPTLVAFQFCLSLVSVTIANLLAPFSITFFNVLISLIAAMLATGLASLFFYYFFLIVFEKQLSFIKIFTLVLFAHIPFAIFHLAGYFFPPSDLIGLMISGMLMVIGLVENFNTPKRIAIKLMAICYSVFLVYWIAQMIISQDHVKEAEPKPLDKIEKEVQDFFNE